MILHTFLSGWWPVWFFHTGHQFYLQASMRFIALLAGMAKAGCPVSKLFKADIALDTTLLSSATGNWSNRPNEELFVEGTLDFLNCAGLTLHLFQRSVF
jgi:hypothetical protein